MLWKFVVQIATEPSWHKSPWFSFFLVFLRACKNMSNEHVKSSVSDGTQQILQLREFNMPQPWAMVDVQSLDLIMRWHSPQHIFGGRAVGASTAFPYTVSCNDSRQKLGVRIHLSQVGPQCGQNNRETWRGFKTKVMQSNIRFLRAASRHWRAFHQVHIWKSIWIIPNLESILNWDPSRKGLRIRRGLRGGITQLNCRMFWQAACTYIHIYRYSILHTSISKNMTLHSIISFVILNITLNHFILFSSVHTLYFATPHDPKYQSLTHLSTFPWHYLQKIHLMHLHIQRTCCWRKPATNQALAAFLLERSGWQDPSSVQLKQLYMATSVVFQRYFNVFQGFLSNWVTWTATYWYCMF